MRADPKATALFVGAFFDELMRGGVRHAVVSPGSRSTPLAMVAYEASRRFPDKMKLHLDVDERGAAFAALGIAKASGAPACAICTSGTAVGNYFPAVLEAESSRVPLLLLTGDRPPRLQGLGAPQTCDQAKAFGGHVSLFLNMPLPAPDDDSLAFARQAAREALAYAGGLGSADAAPASADEEAAVEGLQRFEDRAVGGAAAFGAPVHVNFPFEEPLKPDTSLAGLFDSQRSPVDGAVGPVLHGRDALGEAFACSIADLLRGRRTVVLAGEGSAATEADAQRLLAWAARESLPVLADPLSGLRSFAADAVIDNYDNVFGCADYPAPEAVIRFGRYPVSKRTTSTLAAHRPIQVVVDKRDSRDFLSATDVLVQCAPEGFVRSMLGREGEAARFGSTPQQRAFFADWLAVNEAQLRRIAAVDEDGAGGGSEGAFVRALIDGLGDGSCLFAANSMAIRAVDTFYTKSGKRLRVLCNRGLNGIDGTVSSAIGVAWACGQVTLLTGDLTLLHDINSLALQRELLQDASEAPNVVIVLLNNNGGGIFDMLPQRSDDPYFERLFLTPQDVDFASAAAAFRIPYAVAETPGDLRRLHAEAVGRPGIVLIEAKVPLRGLPERYADYW